MKINHLSSLLDQSDQSCAHCLYVTHIIVIWLLYTVAVPTQLLVGRNTCLLCLVHIITIAAQNIQYGFSYLFMSARRHGCQEVRCIARWACSVEPVSLFFMIKRAVFLSISTFFRAVLEQNPHTPLLCDMGRIIFSPGIPCYSRGPHGIVFQWGEETWQASVLKTLPEICSRAPALQQHWQTAVTSLTFPSQLPLERNPNKCCYSRPNSILLYIGRCRFASGVWQGFKGFCERYKLLLNWLKQESPCANLQL